MSLLPEYTPPDFTRPDLVRSPPVQLQPAPADGVLPEGFHITSNLPEYVHLGAGRWLLVRQGRMDAALVLRGERLEVVEARLVRRGDPVVVARTRCGEEGVLVHSDGFAVPAQSGDPFAFRTRGTRESPFSRSYDTLYRLLRHERQQGYIVWVLGPAVVFDRDSRSAMAALIDAGYCHALLAGNALGVHDLEADCFGTGLGQDIYTQELRANGHFNHLDAINLARRCGSIAAALATLPQAAGVLAACERSQVPYVLAGSIRDDGPLPGVLGDVYAAQDAMRVHARRATTVLALATQLHSIAFGNMLPGYQVSEAGTVRPVCFYVVDIAEFGLDKLANRGSLQAIPVVTNVQDFIVNLAHNLCEVSA